MSTLMHLPMTASQNSNSDSPWHFIWISLILVLADAESFHSFDCKNNYVGKYNRYYTIDTPILRRSFWVCVEWDSNCFKFWISLIMIVAAFGHCNYWMSYIWRLCHYILGFLVDFQNLFNFIVQNQSAVQYESINVRRHNVEANTTIRMTHGWKNLWYVIKSKKWDMFFLEFPF